MITVQDYVDAFQIIREYERSGKLSAQEAGEWRDKFWAGAFPVEEDE